MNWRAEEDFLAQREEERNARITRALIGSMKPPDDGIIKNLQERRVKEIGYFYWEMQVLRKRDNYHRRRSRRRR